VVSNHEVSTRASHLLARFKDPSTHSSSHTFTDGVTKQMSAVQQYDCCRNVGSCKVPEGTMQAMRPDDVFAQLLTKVERQIVEFDLDPLTVPRARKPSLARNSCPAEAIHTNSVETHYRIEYVKLIDVAVQQLNERFLECPGLVIWCLRTAGGNSSIWSNQ
jgi:hypothetical protein